MKNQKSSILALGFVMMGLLSCNNASTTTEETPVMESPAPTSAASTPSDLPPLSSIPESTPPVSANTPPPTSANLGGPLGVNPAIASSSAPLASLAPAASSTPISSPKAAVSTGRLNPAHGQPGHDCAIPVGAPLKNTSAVKASPAPTQPAAVTTTPALETKAVAAPAVANVPNLNPNAKINPAHGQPGHDCSVAVGAPLPVK